MKTPIRVARDGALARRVGEELGCDLVVWVALDEVGRGALAGPLVVGATSWCCRLSNEVKLTGWPSWLAGVRDSKKLTPGGRRQLLDAHPWAQTWGELWQKAFSSEETGGPPPLSKPSVFHHINTSSIIEKIECKELFSIDFLGASVGIVGATQVDRWGLSKALGWAGTQAFEGLGLQGGAHYLLCDGKSPFALSNALANTPQYMAVGGDDLFASIGFSSVVAKVLRDTFMENISTRYPSYGFDAHKGYGTETHRLEVAQKGPIAGVHRMTFLPKEPKTPHPSLF